jgi:hypothetical protein
MQFQECAYYNTIPYKIFIDLGHASVMVIFFCLKAHNDWTTFVAVFVQFLFLITAVVAEVVGDCSQSKNISIE